MALSKILIPIIILLTAGGILKAQEIPDPEINSLINSGIRDIITQDYRSAFEKFDSLDKKYPELPLGRIYTAAAEIAEAYDFGEKFDGAQIIKDLTKAKDLSEALLDKDSKNIWNRYFLALSEGYYAYFEALNQRWVSAITNGLNSVGDFEKCLKLNPDFYEAYIAIGTYKYWKSRKTEFLQWLPFLTNEEKAGVGLLEESVKHPTYNTYLAINSLIWIYIDRKEYKKAELLADSSLRYYPGSRFFMWGLARACEETDPGRAIKIYGEILGSYPSSGRGRVYNEIVIKHIIAQIYQRTGRKEEALQLCREILSIKDIPEYAREKLSGRLRRVEAMERELSK